MSEIALLPFAPLTLTPNVVLVHVQPTIAVLPSISLSLVTAPPKVIVDSDWPASLTQFFLSDGSYIESPFPVTQETATDSGVQKTRKRFTGKFTLYVGTVWLRNNTEYDIFMSFYEGEADSGNAFFTMPFPSSGGAKTVRFVSGSLSVTPDGGIGWRANFQLVQRPEAL